MIELAPELGGFGAGLRDLLGCFSAGIGEGVGIGEVLSFNISSAKINISHFCELHARGNTG